MPRRPEQEQLALFGLGRVPNLWTRDFRSVGELLTDSDFQARQLLMDLKLEDAPQLLVAWPQVLFAARDLWDEFPSAPTPIAAEIERRRMELLVLRGNGYRTALQRARRYLADIEPDSRLIDIADTVARATRLVHKFGAEIDVTKEPAKSDLKAARTRLLHTLYLITHAAHASVRQLRTETFALQAIPVGLLPQLENERLPHVMCVLDSWVHRLGSTEATVGHALGGAYPAITDGELVAPADDGLRLPRALATWEVAVSRILCSEPTNADVTLIARTEGLITAAAHRVLGADPTDRYVDVLGRCEPCGAGWAGTASWWHLLAPTNARVSDSLVAAASEVRAATRALTLDRTRPAANPLIAAHPAYADAVEALLISLDEALDTASAIADRSRTSQLRGPARAVSRAAHDLAEQASMETDIVWVSPADTLADRMIPLPQPVKTALRATACALESDAAALARSAAQTGARPALSLAPVALASAARRPRTPQLQSRNGHSIGR